MRLPRFARETCHCARVNNVSGPFFREGGQKAPFPKYCHFMSTTCRQCPQLAQLADRVYLGQTVSTDCIPRDTHETRHSNEASGAQCPCTEGQGVPARCERAEQPGRFCAIYALWGEAVVKSGVVSFGGHLCNAVMLGETKELASTQHATGHDISGAIHIAHLTSLTHADVPPYPPLRLGVHKRAHIHTHTQGCT